MSERGLEWEQMLIGWLAHSPKGRSEFSSFFLPGVLENAGVDKYVDLLLKHGPGSAGARLKELLHTGSIDPQDVETAIRWAAGAPSVDDGYMLETARDYIRRRCHAVHAEQVALASDVWDDGLMKAADTELRKRLSGIVERENNGFTAAGVSKAFSSETQEDLFRIPGYAGRIFHGRLIRGALVAFQAQPKTGKSATLARMDVAAMRYGRRVLHISVGDEDEDDTAARIISCECQRNGMSYGENGYRGVACCAKALAGCDKDDYARAGYGPLQPPVPAQYLEETEVPAILSAFPSFRPCTLCKGTPEYVPSIWWEMANDAPITETEAVDLYEQIVACGEYGRVETLFYPARHITVAGLGELLDKRAAEGDPVDVLTIDYADMMGLEQTGAKGARWEGLQCMWEEMRALAKIKNCLILTATQGNRSGGDMTTQNSTTVAGTRASIDNCTLVVALNQTPAERAHHLLRLSVVAARKGSFAPEHQAMCLSRMDIQDMCADSWHTWKKADKRREDK